MEKFPRRIETIQIRGLLLGNGGGLWVLARGMRVWS
jgi:hypothetical protein